MKDLPLWRCPVCGDEQRALASEVRHRCPERVVQPAPERSKKRRPEWVAYERVTDAKSAGSRA